ncbi:hypothetical protein vB_PsyM_KIL4_0175 [Pseudomonas phage vB_PsyM_KIL4]|uniref:Uncharacterized protein n=2 Tax=Flaumdravirus TaxID=2560133 RepID=A0A142IF94_9CAUD|nr:hypothetical protein FDI83_gp038 [Pseudomonas phage vB_PsyM_KIL4]AMR57899.1 hypothetical protein vB_PsyM_KIL4_0175 [Pseudomonas phage vB_PsyM_KIL4]AMR58069.1 hypothetical protein vB_PsyM_KIL5_0178 [Pseudomonas phage vB_PsyM_KIL5]
MSFKFITQALEVWHSIGTLRGSKLVVARLTPFVKYVRMNKTTDVSLLHEFNSFDRFALARYNTLRAFPS